MIGTLIVVDDEPLFRRGLRKLIETHLPQWTCIGEASNGEEAITCIEERMPDLVISDIRMPLCDGLQLAEHIHTRKWATKIIIVTGYRDFEYAQAALRFGVLDFLLKPCPEEKVLEILEREYEAIRELRDKEQAERERREEERIRARFLNLPLSGGVPSDPSEPDVCLGKTLMFLRVERYVAESKRFSERDLPLVQFALMNIVKELMDDHHSTGKLIPLGDHLFAMLLQPRSEEDAAMFAGLIGRTLMQLLGIRVECILSGVIGPNDVLSGKMPAAATPNLETGIDADWIDSLRLKAKEMEQQLLHRIEAGQTEAWMTIVRAWVEELAGADMREMRMEALAIGASLHFVAKKVLGAEPGVETLWGQTKELGAAESAPDVRNWAQSLAEQFIELIKTYFEQASQRAIAQAVAFIDQHYKESISLGEVAASVFLNPNYFSWLFRKETGHSFVHYVTKVRMERAVVLLMNTAMKVTEIASAVGYDDPNYFTTVFRKLYKESPLQYRKRLKGPDI